MAFISRGFITTHNQSAVGAASQHLSSRRCRRPCPRPSRTSALESLGLRMRLGASAAHGWCSLWGGSQEGLGSGDGGRPDPTSSWGMGGVGSLPSLGSGPGLWGRIWGTADPSSPRKPGIAWSRSGESILTEQAWKGARKTHLGWRAPQRGVRGRGDPCPTQVLPTGLARSTTAGGPCVRGQVGSPSPVTSTLYTALNTECPQDRLGAGRQGHTLWGHLSAWTRRPCCLVSGPVASSQ